MKGYTNPMKILFFTAFNLQKPAMTGISAGEPNPMRRIYMLASLSRKGEP
jgi:hypothetical protein